MTLALNLALSLVATVLADWDLPELTARADRIVVADVLRQEPVWRDGRAMLETRVRVLESLRGEGPPELRISQIARVEGDAQLVPGRRMLLFTYRHPDGHRYLVGMALGAFFVDGDRVHQRLEAPRLGAGDRLLPPTAREHSLATLRAGLAARSAR